MDETQQNTDDIRIEEIRQLIPPSLLLSELPILESSAQLINSTRADIESVLNGLSDKLLVVVGPCSIHDRKAAIEYAEHVKKWISTYSSNLLIVMRVYFEKPRTTVGWKGLINDPHLNDSFNIVDGLKIGRKLLVDLAELGLPTSTEALDPVSPQYLQDMISWSAIGARTTESQTHREMASGLSSAVGFKNGTDGGLDVAINALQSVSAPHRFLGINHEGAVSVIHTRGNRHAHIVLRGGGGTTNYDSVNVSVCERQLLKAGIPANIMIDCSHANSNKDHNLQPLVMKNVANQIIDGNRSIIGLMVESNINAGNQSITDDLGDLQYGVSVTDKCLDWETTETMIKELQQSVGQVLLSRGPLKEADLVS